MSSHILGLFRHRRRGEPLTRQARRFGRRTEGATVVEFAIVAFPFLAIMFAIIEVALVFFASQVLETATADSARRIMTGEVQNAGMDRSGFKSEVCGRLHAMFNCANLHIDVKNYSSFPASVSPPAFDQEKSEVDVSDFTFEPGKQGDIVVVRAAYEWPVLVPKFGFDLATLPNGKRLLMATAAFRNEPYKSN